MGECCLETCLSKPSTASLHCGCSVLMNLVLGSTSNAVMLRFVGAKVLRQKTARLLQEGEGVGGEAAGAAGLPVPDGELVSLARACCCSRLSGAALGAVLPGRNALISTRYVLFFCRQSFDEADKQMIAYRYMALGYVHACKETYNGVNKPNQ